MEEETRQTNGVSWSMEFTVPGQFLDVLKRNLSRVKMLFKVKVTFSSAFARGDVKMQWISLMGRTASADELNNAKSFITAMTNPEVCISVENFPVSVFETHRDQVEKDTAAFLQYKNDAVVIKGSELAVVLAQSMLESFQEERNVDDTKKLQPMQLNDTQYACSSQSSTTLRTKSVQTTSSETTSPKTWLSQLSPNTPSSLISIPFSSVTLSGNRSSAEDIDLTHVKTRVQNSDIVENIVNSAPSFASTFQSSSSVMDFDFIRNSSKDKLVGNSHSNGVDLQYNYLRNIGLAHRFEKSVVSEGLTRFDMGDIVKPAEFLNVLKDIQLGKVKNDEPSTSKGSGHPGSRMPSSQGTSESNTSCIVIDSDDNGDDDDDDDDDDDSRGKIIDAIVISSDEEKNVLSRKKWQVNHKKKKMVKTKQKAEAMAMPVNDCLLPVPSTSTRTRKLRYIVIDGSNVAMAHGESRVYSVPGIQICINFFLKRGHKVTAFVPESRRYTNNHIPIAGKHLLEKLNKDGTLKFTPARRLPTGKTIASYDDRFILNLADVEEGIVVSNDHYRDLLDAKPSYKNIIESRLLPFTFVGDHFMPPDDPLGRDGPPLDYFLSHDGGNTGSSFVPLATSTGKIPFQNRSETVTAGQASLFGKHGSLPLWSFSHESGQGRQASGYAVDSKKTEEKEKGQKVLQTNAEAMRQARLRYFNANSNDDRTAHDGDSTSPPPVARGDPRSRTIEQTEALFSELSLLFTQPEQKEYVKLILRNHPLETDLTRLSNYVINASAM